MAKPRDFGEKFNEKRKAAADFYEANSDDAWERVKSAFGSPKHWIVGAIIVLLAVAAGAVVAMLASIRPPDIPADHSTPPQQIGDRQDGAQEGSDPEARDDEADPRAERPEVSGSRKKDFYTCLVFATDQAGENTDTIMLVSYDIANRQISLMSIPRDTMINVSWDIKKINSVYGVRGLDGFKNQLRKLIGFTPDFYVKVNLKAFVEVVDLIGGIDFEVPRAMNYDDPYQNLHIHFEKGMQHLDGQQAMEVVRYRNDNAVNGRKRGYNDTGRMQTQQAFLKALFQKCIAIENWPKVSGYIEIFNENVESDLELGEMLWFAQQASKLDGDAFSTYTMPGNYEASAWSRTFRSYQSYVTVNASELVRLINEHFNPYEKDVTVDNLDVMSINRDGSVSSSTGVTQDSRAAQPPDIPKNTGKSSDPEPGGDTEGGGADEPDGLGKADEPDKQDEPDVPPIEDPDIRTVDEMINDLTEQTDE